MSNLAPWEHAWEKKKTEHGPTGSCVHTGGSEEVPDCTVLGVKKLVQELFLSLPAYNCFSKEIKYNLKKKKLIHL